MTNDQIAQVIDEIAEQGWVFGDFNGDGNVSLPDLSRFAESWLETDCDKPDWCTQGDVNMDGQVDTRDLAVIADNWFWKE
jgi:hypothetical protein